MTDVALSAGETPAVPGDLERSAGGWLLGFGSPHTRAAYRRDLTDWLAFCQAQAVDPRTARRGHVDAFTRSLEASGRAPATVARKLAALSSWYRWLVDEDVIAANPVERVRRPRVPEDSATLGPTVEEARRLLAAADADGPKAASLIALLLLNGLRVGETIAADVEDLGTERDHRVLRIRRKGGRVALVPLASNTGAALDALLEGRTTGPIFVGQRGAAGPVGRLTSSGAAHIVRRVRRAAKIDKQLSPHALRHGFVTLTLEAGIALSDVQDAAGHADPRTTRRYDRARHRLEHAPTYRLAERLTGAA
jgi:site-specific recombinase XerD